jgi:hypothetical protein
LQGQVLVFTLDCESKVDFAGYKTQESTFAKQKLTTYAVEKLERLTEKNFSLYTAAVTAFKEYVKVLKTNIIKALPKTRPNHFLIQRSRPL